jgi:hypothetical protein
MDRIDTPAGGSSQFRRRAEHAANSPGGNMAVTRFPRKDPDARTGSSLRGQPLLAYHQAELARVAKPHERLAREHYRQSRKLFSKADLRRAAEISRQVNREWREASVRTGGDTLKIDALKLSARRKLERMFGRDLPHYRQWKTMQRAQLREHEKLTQTTHAASQVAGSHINWGALGTLQGTAQEFVPPFTSFDVETTTSGDFIVSDQSFAKPGIGHLVNNIVYDQNESTSIGAGLWGILPIENASSLASCGVAFTTPAAGRLKISAELQNFYNKVMFSVTDKFGFSSADVRIFLSLFISVVRGTRVEHLTKDLLATGLISHGSDLSYAQSDLDNSTPYTISAETATRLDANESVLVLAGSEVQIGTILDDMHCKVNAVLWWQLRKLVIDMAVDVIT